MTGSDWSYRDILKFQRNVASSFEDEWRDWFEEDRQTYQNTLGSCVLEALFLEGTKASGQAVLDQHSRVKSPQ